MNWIYFCKTMPKNIKLLYVKCMIDVLCMWENPAYCVKEIWNIRKIYTLSKLYIGLVRIAYL